MRGRCVDDCDAELAQNEETGGRVAVIHREEDQG